MVTREEVRVHSFRMVEQPLRDPVEALEADDRRPAIGDDVGEQRNYQNALLRAIETVNERVAIDVPTLQDLCGTCLPSWAADPRLTTTASLQSRQPGRSRSSPPTSSQIAAQTRGTNSATSKWFRGGRLWGIYDRSLGRAYGKQYEAINLPENPTYTTHDVSILVPTINIPEEFTQCLLKWVANKPKEILIVTTTQDSDNVTRLAQPVLQEVQTATIIRIYTVPEPGRREQIKLVLEKATGNIVAFVDDDTIWPTEKVLPFLIAGFEDPEVGGVAGKQRQVLHAFISTERRDPNTVTPWEVAAMRLLSDYNHGTAAQYAADGGVFCLVGRTMLARATAVQNPELLDALTNEFWRGKKINTGGDSFLTRWLHTKGWKFCIQNAPEAEVLPVVERDATSVKQLVRW
ncbi:hypothetical protein DL769_001759 [Monosporascus sp. CRB-8-3]|nr:hypothetical protein DL769_001759 [Monosporascus sp. CRB-8-3]